MRRRWLRRGALIAGAVLVLGGVVLALLSSRIGAWVVRTRVIPRVERQLGVTVRVGAVKVGFGRVRLDRIEVQSGHAPLAQVASVAATFDPWDALTGDVSIGEVVIDRPIATLVREADGTDNWSAPLARLRRKDGGGGTGGGGRGPASVIVRQGSLTAEDRRHGARLAVAAFEGEARRRGPATLRLERVSADTDLGPAATAERLIIEADLADLAGTASLHVEGGRVAVSRDMSLSGIGGSVARNGDGDRLHIDLQGGYGGVEGTLWRAEGWLDPARRDADVHLRADRFTLDKLASILDGTPVLEPARTSVETSVDLALRGDDLTFAGAVGLSGLTVFDPWLADEPVRDFGFQGTVRGHLGVRARQLDIEALAVDVRGVEVRLDGSVALPGGEVPGGGVRDRARLSAHLVVPPVACQSALAAIPPEIVPSLQGFKLSGTFRSDVQLSIDWADLDALVLDGSVGIAGCRFLETPAEMSVERLGGEFEHTVEVEQDRWIAFVIGPSNPDFVPITDVSPHLVNSLMTTEDSSFYKHRGFIVREFRTALIRNLKEGYFKYGASSITMQLVKNLLLGREKTVARKLQELFLTHYLETVLEKDRIFELYVNAIEFGPEIYGIGPAARHYFGKHPRDLNPVEAAFFSSILPDPKGRYLQYCEGRLSRWGDAKVGRILKVMRDRERLTEEEYQAALATPLVFDRTAALPVDECKKTTRRIMKNARPTLPPRRTRAERTD